MSLEYSRKIPPAEDAEPGNPAAQERHLDFGTVTIKEKGNDGQTRPLNVRSSDSKKCIFTCLSKSIWQYQITFEETLGAGKIERLAN